MPMGKGLLTTVSTHTPCVEIPRKKGVTCIPEPQSKLLYPIGSKPSCGWFSPCVCLCLTAFVGNLGFYQMIWI